KVQGSKLVVSSVRKRGERFKTETIRQRVLAESKEVSHAANAPLLQDGRDIRGRLQCRHRQGGNEGRRIADDLDAVRPLRRKSRHIGSGSDADVRVKLLISQSTPECFSPR